MTMDDLAYIFHGLYFFCSKISQAYAWREICISKLIRLAYRWKEIYVSYWHEVFTDWIHCEDLDLLKLSHANLKYNCKFIYCNVKLKSNIND